MSSKVQFIQFSSINKNPSFRTVGDIIQFNQSRGEKMKEPGPAWLELGVAILLDESTSCRFDKYKDPLMSFAQKLWNMVNRASKDHRGGMYRKQLADIQNAGFS